MALCARGRDSPPTGGSRVAAMLIATAILVIQLPVLLETARLPNFNGYGGIDYELYMSATRRWLQGGHFYELYQLAGPYVISHGDVLYPPVALWLFVPFVFLPALVWWAIPLAVTLGVVVHLRPSIVVWPLMAACLGWQPAHIHIISGNPVIWAMAAVALGTVYKWPSAFALIKPSLFVFAFFGMRDRAWWLGLGLVALLSVPFLSMWLDSALGRPQFARRRHLLLMARGPAAAAAAHRLARSPTRKVRTRGASGGRRRPSRRGTGSAVGRRSRR